MVQVWHVVGRLERVRTAFGSATVARNDDESGAVMRLPEVEVDVREMVAGQDMFSPSDALSIERGCS